MKRVILEVDVVAGVCRRRFKNGVVKVVNTLNSYGYVVVNVQGKLKMVHRVIWEHVHGPIPYGLQIDHINGVRTDNKIANLRLVTNAENQQNKHKALSKNVTGVKGVVLHNLSSKFRSLIGFNGKQYCLGYFETIEEAAAAYQGAAAILHTHNPHAKKEGPAETDPKGLQHPRGETTTGNTGISV